MFLWVILSPIVSLFFSIWPSKLQAKLQIKMKEGKPTWISNVWGIFRAQFHSPLTWNFKMTAFKPPAVDRTKESWSREIFPREIGHHVHMHREPTFYFFWKSDCSQNPDPRARRYQIASPRSKIGRQILYPRVSVSGQISTPACRKELARTSLIEIESNPWPSDYRSNTWVLVAQ